MSSAGAPPIQAEQAPELAFSVESAAPLEHAAVPTLRLRLAIEAGPGDSIRSVLLDVQIQIAARQRPYGEQERARLVDLFGTPDRWADTLRTLPWLRTTVVVPPFVGATSVDVDVPCSYDLEVTAANYLQALGDGEVPLELLFSGTVFYATTAGLLQVAKIPWTQEASYGLPVRVWREVMDRHFPNAAWLRLDRDAFGRLQAYRARRALPSWEATLDELLERGDG